MKKRVLSGFLGEERIHVLERIRTIGGKKVAGSCGCGESDYSVGEGSQLKPPKCENSLDFSAQNSR